jgi:hypothetical protein
MAAETKAGRKEKTMAMMRMLLPHLRGSSPVIGNKTMMMQMRRLPPP